MMTVILQIKGLVEPPSSSTSRGQRGPNLRCLRTWRTWASRWPLSATLSRPTLTGWPSHWQACSLFLWLDFLLSTCFSGPGGKIVIFETSKAGRLTDGVYPSFINGVRPNFISWSWLIRHISSSSLPSSWSILGEHSRLWLWPVQHAPAGLCKRRWNCQGLDCAWRRTPRAGHSNPQFHLNISHWDDKEALKKQW